MLPTKLKSYFPCTVKTHSPCIITLSFLYSIYRDTQQQELQFPHTDISYLQPESTMERLKNRVPKHSYTTLQNWDEKPCTAGQHFQHNSWETKKYPICYLKRLLTLWWEISCTVYMDCSKREKKFSVRREKKYPQMYSVSQRSLLYFGHLLKVCSLAQKRREKEVFFFYVIS